jgi:hypothetical protein
MRKSFIFLVEGSPVNSGVRPLRITQQSSRNCPSCKNANPALNDTSHGRSNISLEPTRIEQSCHARLVGSVVGYARLNSGVRLLSFVQAENII